MPNLSLSPQVFAILSALIEERVGLSYTANELTIFESKASARVLDAGFESMLDYYYYLRYDDPDQNEFRSLVEALLVHETFFFRELPALRVAIEQLIAPRVHAGRRVRIWSAACATGEEPLTIAMLLREAGLTERVELIASDLSESALARARRGVFSPRALRQHRDEPLAQRYLTLRDDALHVDPSLLAGIDFRCINLIDPRAVDALGVFDLVVCRNVLIYFRDTRARAAAPRLASRLRPGGALLVGASESLLRFGTALHCEERSGVFVYRREETS